MMILMKFDEKYASCNDMQCYLVFTVELESYVEESQTIYGYTKKKDV